MPASFMESPRFPDDISVGVSFGPEFVTTIASNQAGYEYRNRVRSRALSKGDCTHSVKTQAQFKTLVTFFRSVGGRFSGFRFKDWSDYKVDYSDSYAEPITNTINQYQINKLYRAAVGFEEYRQIKKLVSGTLVVKDAGATLTAGASAGNYSVDNNTGIVTLVAKQTRAVSTHTVGASHIVVLASALSPNVTVGQKVSFSGVTGTAATTLNGQNLTVSAVNGATVTVSVSTAGLTATGGTLLLYSQQADLTFYTEFDVPARFDTDHMPAVLTHPDVFDWGQIPIVEIRV